MHMELPSHHYGRLVPRDCPEGVFHIYASHLHQTPLKLEPAVPYRTYIQWLMEQDKEAAARYWEGYLEGYDQQSRLPQQKKAGAKSRQEEVTFSLSKTVTDKLKELAAKEEVTLSTIFTRFGECCCKLITRRMMRFSVRLFPAGRLKLQG